MHPVIQQYVHSPFPLFVLPQLLHIPTAVFHTLFLDTILLRRMQLLLVDDHPLFLKGLKSFLQNEDVIGQVFIADNYNSIFQICKKTKIDVILMDVHLGTTSGIQLTKKIKNIFPELKVLGLSANNNDMCIREMMEAGASGFVLKDVDLDELKIALQFVMKGKTYFSSSVSQQTYTNSNYDLSKTAVFKNKLTSREFEILNYLIEKELGNKEIAEKLFISPRTVETHKRNLIQKLKVKNTVGLAKFYLENGNWLKDIYGIPVA